MKQSKTKCIAQMVLVILAFMSLSYLGSCGMLDIFNSTTTSVLRTTVPNTLDFSDAENTFETASTSVDTTDGEAITITHGEDFNEDDIEFLLTLHEKTRNDREICEPPIGHNLKTMLTLGQNGNPIFLAHFENPYYISAYLKTDAPEYEPNEWGAYKFDVTKYVWYKFYNSEQLVDEMGGMKRTEDTYLLYDCIINRDIVNGVEYNKNAKYYTKYQSEYIFNIITPNMLLSFDRIEWMTDGTWFVPYQEYGAGTLEVYVDPNGIEYLYFYYGSYYEDGTKYEDYTQKSFGEHYEYLSQYFEILDEYINDSSRILKSAGIKLDILTKYLNDGR